MFPKNNGIESDEATNSGLREDVAALKSDVAALRDDALAAGRHGVRSATDKIGEMAGKTRSAVRSAVDDLDLRADDLRSTITQNPLLSVGAAVAIGFFLGKAAVRRD